MVDVMFLERHFMNRGQLGRVRLSCKPFNSGSTARKIHPVAPE